MKWGILGARGYIAGVFIDAVKAIQTATVTQLGTRSPGDSYVTYDDVLASDVDAVYVALPNSMHFDWIEKCLEAGKHVLAEKPVCLTVKEADTLFALAHSHGLVLDEGYMYRHHPQFHALTDTIESGLIGHVNMVRASFAYPVDSGSGNIRLDGGLGGGALFDVGCYVVDTAVQAYGRAPHQVRMDNRFRDGQAVATTSLITMDFGDGALAIGDASIDYGPCSSYEVQGPQGSLRVSNAWAFKSDESAITVRNADGQRQLGAYVSDHYANEIADFSAAVGGNPATYEPRLWRETLSTLEAATLSTGEWIDVR